MFIGLYNLDASLYLKCQTKNSSGTPTAADTNAVTYRIYSAAGGAAILSGSYSTTVVDSQTGLYITTALTLSSANGFASGNTYLVRIAYAISGTNYVETQYFTVT
jgi:hypothetical protein